jgi:hypothetical protein
MKAVYSKNQFSPYIVVNTATREKTYGALILFPAIDGAALAAMKTYIDIAAMEKDADPEEVDNIRREYERIKNDRNAFKEYSAWNKGE